MAKEPLGNVLHYIRQISSAPANQELTDKELLESFVACRDEAAFAVLVQRHGALVWGVCQRVLQQTEDAEDAFQATFLVLARKAGRIRWQADVGNWLYAVAMRTAMKAKSGASRRCGREGPLQDMPATEMNGESAWLEIKPILDEELNRLPLKYRAPVVLHYFEGKTYAQAAQALGWPAGTVSTRLAQARHLLRGRLARRGIALSTGLLAAALSENGATAMAPAALVDTTIKAATLLATLGWHAFAAPGAALVTTSVLGRESMAPTISGKVATLTEGVLKAMFLTKLKVVAALVLALGALGAGAGVMGYRMLPAVEANGLQSDRPPAQVADADQPKNEKPKQEIEQLRREIDRLRRTIEDLRRELRPLRNKIGEPNPGLLPENKETQQITFQGKPADYWLKMLKDRDPEFRMKAINALGAIGVDDRRVIPALIGSLKDKSLNVAQAAADALGLGIGKDAVPRLLELLKGKDSVLREGAAMALSRIGPKAKEAIPALIESLEDENNNLRSWAASALGSMASESKSAIPVLIKLMKDEDQNVRGSADLALIQFRQLAVPALSEALKDEDDKTRASAAYCLGQIGGAAKGAVPVLIVGLGDKDQKVRQNVGWALARVGPDAVPALVEALKDKDPVIRAASAQVLGEMGPKFANSALPALVKAMGDEDKRVREAAAQAYKHFPSQGQTDP